MKAKIYVGAKKYALYIGRKIVEKTLEFLSLPARFVSKKVQDLKNYLIYGQSVQSNLPSGYTQLDSLSSTGYEYINTGLVMQTGDEVHLDYEWLGNTPDTLSADMMFFGCQNANASIGGVWVEMYRRPVGTLPTWYARFSGTGSNSADASAQHATGRHLLKINSSQMTIDGSLVIRLTTSIGSFQTTPLTLFGRLNQSGTELNSSKLKVFGLKVVNNGIERLNLVPCRNASGVLGMYDTVSNTFLANQGTGSFIAGDIVQPAPINPIDIESVGVRTKNLFDINNPNIFNGYYSPSTNAINSYPANAFVYIPIEGGKTYIVSGLDRYDKSILVRVCTIKSLPYGGIPVSKTTAVQLTEQATLTTDIDDKYLLVFVCGDGDYTHYGSVQNAISSNCARLQIEEGTQSTPYEPYGYKVPVVVNGTTTNIYLNEPLRKLGDYVDYIDYESQKVVRNVAQHLLTEATWTKSGTSTASSVRYFGSNTPDYSKAEDSVFLVSCFKFDGVGSSGSYYSPNDNCFRIYTSGSQNEFYVTCNSANTVNEFMNLIDGQYYICPRVTPIEEAITLPAISLPQGTVTIDIDTVIKPSKLNITGDIDNE